eukprot:GHVU01034624.1.p1 GENE.GHVU01034624.1~~GHVU01034624.1.p1  ORF type:complete len:100 (+),score=1.62 GHVU01034624.1:1325-1624(+)
MPARMHATHEPTQGAAGNDSDSALIQMCIGLSTYFHYFGHLSNTSSHQYLCRPASIYPELASTGRAIQSTCRCKYTAVEPESGRKGEGGGRGDACQPDN